MINEFIFILCVRALHSLVTKIVIVISSACAQPWQPFNGPSVFAGRDIVVKRMLH